MKALMEAIIASLSLLLPLILMTPLHFPLPQNSRAAAAVSASATPSCRITGSFFFFIAFPLVLRTPLPFPPSKKSRSAAAAVSAHTAASLFF